MHNTNDRTETTTHDNAKPEEQAVPFFARRIDNSALVVRTSIRAGGGKSGEQLVK